MRVGGSSGVAGLCLLAAVGGALGGCRSSLGQHAPRVDGGAARGDGGLARGDGGPNLQPPGPGPDGGRDGIPTGPLSGDGGAKVTPGVGEAGAPPDAPMRQVEAVCPDAPATAVPPLSAAPARIATNVPFSCNPMPRSLIFPAPSSSTPGLYGRCASFSAGAVGALALSPDGRLAAMVNGDGVARVVEVASQQVVALVAPPRARVSRVAFSPDGATLATVAGQQHQVTAYSTSTWAPLWTTTLPGTLYGYTDWWSGAITFSPDGKSIAVSPGADLYLLDSSGTLRASYPSLAILDVRYAWNGQRLVAADASLTGSCSKGPFGGAIVVLDPASLAKLETLASWAGYSTDIVRPAFRASPTDDLVLVPPSSRDPNPALHAFKPSDGSELPRPTMTALPVAFLPDGDLLLAGSGTLGIQPFGGATSVKISAPTSQSTVFAVSADGSAVAMGGDGDDLLHVWHLADSYALGVCSFDDAAPGPMTISGDGRVAAVAVGGFIRVVRPDDGTLLATLNGNGQPFEQLMLSRTGRYVAVVEYPPLLPVEDLSTPLENYLQIIAVPGDGLVADLSRHDGYLGGFLFSPDETAFYETWFSNGAGRPGTLAKIDLSSGKVIATRAVPSNARPIGFSRGCPVLLDASGAYRSCDTCDEPALPGGAVVAPDGTAALTADGYPANTATLWSLPGEQKVQVFGPPSVTSAGPWALQTFPVGAAAGGAEVLIGTGTNQSCYAGPGYQTLLQDVSGRILDTLPPGGVPASEDLGRLLYGTELWCRR